MSPPRKPRRPASGEGRGRGRASARPPRILFVDGPNLNVLGRREPEVYGARTLEEIRRDVSVAARKGGAAVDFFQSNHEGEIVGRLQEAAGRSDGIVINPGAYTHTSVAIRDALLYAGLPVVEVHLSNPARREPFRKSSMIEDVAVGRIAGFGGFGYVLAFHAMLDHLRTGGGRGPK